MERGKWMGWVVGVTALAASGGFLSVAVASALTGADLTTRGAELAPGPSGSGEQALARLRDAGYTTVLELEREGNGYEATVLDADGRRHEVRLAGDGTGLDVSAYERTEGVHEDEHGD